MGGLATKMDILLPLSEYDLFLVFQHTWFNARRQQCFACLLPCGILAQVICARDRSPLTFSWTDDSRRK